MYQWEQHHSFHGYKKFVTVHVNGEFESGKRLSVEPEWTLADLLNHASQRLGLVPSAKRVFNGDGVELNDCMMVVDNDIIFFSVGDEFVPPEYDFNAELKTKSPHDLHRDDGTGKMLPNVVGGYKVGALLGKGAFGEVCEGIHQLTGARVALKFLKKSEISSLGAAERTNNEIQCLTALNHANIIHLMQHLELANHVVLVFELMEGGDLLHYLEEKKRQSNSASSALQENEARNIFYQIICGISYAHNQHICHRDLKLENILLKEKTSTLVKIADFGLSGFYRPGSLIKSNCGTLSFLAPEVFKGTANAGPPLDVWAAGVILFALLCGRLPFEGLDLVGTKKPREAIIKSRILQCQYKIDNNLGPEAKDLVRRMLQLNPSERATVPEVFNHVWLRSASVNHYSLEPSLGRNRSTNVKRKVNIVPDVKACTKDTDESEIASNNESHVENDESSSVKLIPLQRLKVTDDEKDTNDAYNEYEFENWNKTSRSSRPSTSSSANTILSPQSTSMSPKLRRRSSSNSNLILKQYEDSPVESKNTKCRNNFTPSTTPFSSPKYRRPSIKETETNTTSYQSNSQKQSSARLTMRSPVLGSTKYNN